MPRELLQVRPATLPAAFAIDHQLRGTLKPNTEVAFSWLFDLESGRFEHGGTTPGYTAHVDSHRCRIAESWCCTIGWMSRRDNDDSSIT
jgi:hypothetical protein